MNLHHVAARAAGLPSVHLSSNDRRMRNVANARLGATETVLSGPKPPVVEVAGQPSMTLHKRGGGGVVTILRRRSRWTEFITDAELEEMERLLQAAMEEAQALSRGPLSLHTLAAMGHPYAQRGRRRGLGRLQGSRVGVSNRAVVNRQSGALEGSWEVKLTRDKGGITLALINTAEHSQFVALGTTKMRAHGPFTTAMARQLPGFNRAWAALTRRAQARAAVAST